MRKFGLYLIILSILSLVLPLVGFRIVLLTGNMVLTILAAVIGLVLIVLDRN